VLDGFGWPHLLIIAVVLIVLFGAKRLPSAAKGIGQSLKIFKSEMHELSDDEPAPVAPAAPPAAAPAAVAPQLLNPPVAPPLTPRVTSE
jgi:sec-independent protein translocase protein TatA